MASPYGHIPDDDLINHIATTGGTQGEGFKAELQRRLAGAGHSKLRELEGHTSQIKIAITESKGQHETEMVALDLRNQKLDTIATDRHAETIKESKRASRIAGWTLVLTVPILFATVWPLVFPRSEPKLPAEKLEPPKSTLQPPVPRTNAVPLTNSAPTPATNRPLPAKSGATNQPAQH